MKVPPGKTVMDLPRIDMNQYIDWILQNFKFDNQWQADRVLKKHYETTFGVFDHRTSHLRGMRPWSGMAHLPGNSIGKYYDIEFLISKYDDNSIWDILHIDFHTYCMYSPHKMMELEQKCRKIKDAKLRLEEQAAAETQQSIAKSLSPPKGVNGLPPHG